MIKSLIIDDEAHARNAIQRKLEAYCPEIDIIGLAENVAQAYQMIQELKPDLIFLDIAMPVESGFDLLKRFDSIDFEVIFVTGFNTYAIHAIEFCAIGYLLKPVDNEALIKAIHRAKERIAIKNDRNRISELLTNLSNPGDISNKIGIPTPDGLEFIKVKDIIRCEGVQKLTKIVIAEEKKPLYSSYNIGEYIKLLESYGFFTCHKSHLINMSYIKKYHKDGTLTMEDGSYVPVAKRRKKEFLDSLTRL